MIVDRLERILDYEAVLPRVAAAMEAVKALPSLDPCRVEFEGGYLMVQKGETKPYSEGTYEAHRRCIDVQIVVEGSEEMAWESLDRLEECVPYSPERDAARYRGTHEHRMKVTAGMFYAVFPADGHQACAHGIERTAYTKIVLKLPVAG